MKLTKTLGIALVAVLAMSAVVASAASAAKFKATSYPNMVFAEQEASENHEFIVEGNTVKCKKATFTGSEQTEDSPEISVAPAYSECTAFGFVGATVAMNGCKYNFDEPTGSGPYTGTTDVVCEGTNKIVVTASTAFGTCKVEVGSQENKGTVTYTNMETSPTTVTIAANVTKLTYNKATDTGICPLNGTGEVKEGGTYKGNTTASATGGAGASIG